MYLGYMEPEQLRKNPTCERRLICTDGHVSSLNKCNPIQSISEYGYRYHVALYIGQQHPVTV